MTQCKKSNLEISKHIHTYLIWSASGVELARNFVTKIRTIFIRNTIFNWNRLNDLVKCVEIFTYTALPRKNMNLPYSIVMYWTNFWQPTVHVQQNIFEKTLIKIGSSHLYASFGTFCVQIGQFLESQWVFGKCLKTVKSLFSKENDVDYEFFRKFKVSLRLE